ncbi:unnamed protein product [Phytomonas sp. Hart1]|nr:unnamed protein product [Phytomonas sp. Hart1]|eukprot:CCW70921.1 unnamed protein product [Phytomonas sp. isolate Hart1]
MNLRSPEIARRLVDAYIISVRQRLSTQHLRQLSTLPGATDEQVARLCAAYPGAPPELVYFLRRVNGTHWRAPMLAAEMPTGVLDSTSPAVKSTPVGASGAGKTPSAASPSSLAASFLKATFNGTDSKPINSNHITVPILGSALGSCPYYLYSVESILRQPRFPLPSGSLPSRSDLSKTCDTHAVSAVQSPEVDKPPGEAGVGLKKPRSIYELYSGKAEIVRAVPPNLAKAPVKGGRINPLQKLGRRRRERGASGVENRLPDGRTQREGLPGAAADPFPAGFSSLLETTTPNETAASPTQAPAAPHAGASSAPPPLGFLPKVYVDPQVDIHADLDLWLAFADSMHGGQHGLSSSSSAKGQDIPAPADLKPDKPLITVSRLFVDFESARGQDGAIGQIIQYTRDPQESFVVIADDFGSYLKFLMGEELEFTGELDGDEEDTDPCFTHESGKVF